MVNLIARNNNILILGNYKKPTSQGCVESFFESTTIDRKPLLPHKATLNTKYPSFQCQILNNALYLNKTLFKFGKVKSPLYLFCKSVEETIIHLFSECLYAQYIWNQAQIFSDYSTIPNVTP